MINRKQQLLAVLADGAFHSGQGLAARAGVSRTAVWKHLRSLRAAGLEMESVRGRGYRLRQSLDLFDPERLRAELAAAGRSPPLGLEVLFETDSTNRYLLDRFAGPSLHARAVLAEHQTAGRGRGDNAWLSAPASGICLSLGWYFDAAPASFTALSLAAGVATAEALQQAGCPRVRLKWPNDIIVDGAKLGGILIESRGQGAGACDLVVGTGINIRLPGDMARRIDRQVIDVSTLLAPVSPSRNRLAGLLIDRTAAMLEEFGRHGFAAFSDRWRALDCCRGREAVLLLPASRRTGRVIDIDENGLLIMDVEGERMKFSSGELSLRLLP